MVSDPLIVRSPEGRLLVRIVAEREERVAPREHICMWRQAPDGTVEAEPLVAFTSFGAGARVRFTGPASVLLSDVADRAGRPQRLHLDFEALTFADQPNERPQPLNGLRSWLDHEAWERAGIPASTAPDLPPLRRAALAGMDLLSVVGGGLFALAGLWMMLAAENLDDRLAGLAGLIFFGLCAAQPLWERFRRPAAAAEPPPPLR